MSKTTFVQNNLTAGELSPRAMGRFDISKFANGAKLMENFLVNQLGGGFFRPGTRYVNNTRNNGIARVMPFQYDETQDYVMEVGAEYMRFYSDDALIIEKNGYDSYTKLMLHCDGTDASTTFTDETGKTVTVNGNAQIDTAQKKFGTASGLFDGTGDYLTLLDSDDWNFGTGDFTIDFWVRFASVGATVFIVQRVDGNNYWQFDYNGTLLRTSAVDNGVAKWSYNVNWTPAQDTDYHLELVRSGTNLYIFINGVSQTLTVDTAISTNSAPDIAAVLTIGGNADGYLNGWIDEFRLSKGIARHTANFTPSTTEYVGTIPITEEIETDYLVGDIFALHTAQNADVMYITHQDYYPQKLSRATATTFTIGDVPFVRGPFLDTNTTAATVTPSTSAGTGINVSASTALFTTDHVGALWRIKDGVVKITVFLSTQTVTADVQAEPDGTAGNLGIAAATTDWAEGAFSIYRGYPATCAFYEGRLYYGDTPYEPQKFWGSVVGAYDNFDEGSTADDDAVTYEAASEQVNAIRWLMAASKSMQVGTSGGSFSASSGSAALPITPTAIYIERDTNFGAATIRPKLISSRLYYLQRNLFQIRELLYSLDEDKQISNDMCLLADHILRDGDGGIDMDHQQSPNDRLWVVRNDGQLAVLTRNPEQEVMGWSRIVAGEDSSGDGVFESVAVIPKNNEDDQVWVVVKRYIDGTLKRFVEFFTPEYFTDAWDAIRLDCSLTLDSPIVISAATSASPVVITTSAHHGLLGGEQIRITDIVGMTELNDNNYKVVYVDEDNFSLTDLSNMPINGLAYKTYISGGEVREMVTEISGLSHLAGETVSVQADGHLPTTETFVVSPTGKITLPAKAAVVHAGLPYIGTLQLLKLNDGSVSGIGQGKNRRIYLSMIKVNKTQALQIGKDLDNMETVNFNDQNNPLGTYPEPYTGDIEQFFDTWWSKDDEIIIRQIKPLPLDILCIILRSEVED